MSTWVLLQIALNILFALTVVVMWSRLKRPPQDDPRLSRGLQLLQSKISVLEDLSDRTELQVKQLTTLLEKKGSQLQQKIQESAEQINLIDQSMEKSMEVANIFQDKIPHEEIIERQNTVKYVRAARLAHQGMSVDEIVLEVDLPKSEVEFIAKVNRDQLMFDDQQLPQWAKEKEHDMALDGPMAEEDSGPFIEMNDGSPAPVRRETKHASKAEVGVEDWSIESAAASSGDLTAKAKTFQATSVVPDLSDAFKVPEADMSSLQKLGEDFRQACDSFDAKQAKFDREQEMPSQVLKTAGQLTSDFVEKATDSIKASGVERAAENFKTKIIDRASENFKSKVVDRAAETIRTHILDKAERVLQPKERSQVPSPVTPSIISEAPSEDPKVVTSQATTAQATNSSFEIVDDNEESTTHIVPNSYLKDTLNHNRAEDKTVATSEIKTVLFPRIDVNDNLS